MKREKQKARNSFIKSLAILMVMSGMLLSCDNNHYFKKTQSDLLVGESIYEFLYNTEINAFSSFAALEEKDFEDIIYLVRTETAEFLNLSSGEEDIQVALTTDGVDTWAIACIFGVGIDGDPGLYVYRIGSINKHPNPVLVTIVDSPKSPGLSVSILKYDNKYLICGGVSDTHWSILENRLIDLSYRNYMIIDSQTNTHIVLVDRKPVSGFICIMDSEPVEMVIYDGSGNILFRLSERINEVYVKYTSG